MKLSVYKSYDDLPLFLNAKMVAQVLGVSISTAYELLNDPGFPTLRVGSRMVVPKEKVHSVGGGTVGRCQMRKQHWPKRDPIKNYFPLPNEIFSLGLSAGAIAVYGFLLHREDRRTYQCVASYRTIGEAVGMSVNTVRKYVTELEDRGLIRTERTTVTTRDGRTSTAVCVTTSCPSRCPSNSSMRGSSTRLTWRWNDRDWNNALPR